jgi:hypothetical protein
VKKEDEMMAFLCQRRLFASSDDPDDTPGYNDAYMSSVNDHSAWAGNMEDMIAMSIRESGRPLVDLTSDDGDARLAER